MLLRGQCIGVCGGLLRLCCGGGSKGSDVWLVSSGVLLLLLADAGAHGLRLTDRQTNRQSDKQANIHYIVTVRGSKAKH